MATQEIDSFYSDIEAFEAQDPVSQKLECTPPYLQTYKEQLSGLIPHPTR